MKIYTLTGRSGTGKSYHAMSLIKEFSIDGIIDDGLFIYHGIVVGGASAKRSTTKIGAVKSALFNDEETKDKVAALIKEKNPESILILGTSDGMTDKIIDRLGLKAEEIRRIYIEDITTEEERDLARQQREEMGKHAIPAPALQLKHNFAGYFLDPIRHFRGKDLGAAAERTVVRPAYSYMGDYIVNDRAINDIIRIVVGETEGIAKLVYVSHIASAPEAYSLLVAIKLKLGYPAWRSMEEFQRKVVDMIEIMTAFEVINVEVEARGIE